MMKTKNRYLILGSILLINGVGKAQWSLSGSNIYQTTLTNNVGIGTTGPNCPLQITNATTFGNLSSGGTWDVGFNHKNAAAIGNNPNPFFGDAVFGTVAINSNVIFANYDGTTYNERMRIAIAGNIGIGTASPDASSLLDVSATNKGLLIPRVALISASDAGTISSPATSLLVYNTNGGLSPAGYYYNAGTSGTPNWVQLGAIGAWSLNGNSGTTAGTNFIGTTDAVDWVVKTNNAERMRVLSTGNVGIGTTSPAQKLSIFGSNGYPATSGTTQNGIFRIYNGSNNSLDFGNGNASPWGSWIQSTDASNLSTNYPLLLNPNGGNIGIGLTSPIYPLDVLGNAQVRGALGTNPAILYLNPSSNGQIAQFKANNNGATGTLDFIYGGVTAMSIYPGGNVGIGTITPSDVLTVAGNAVPSVDNTYTLTG